LIPADNEKDLAEVPDNVKKGLEIIPLTMVDDVIAAALTESLTPIEWNPKDDDVDVAVSGSSGGGHSGITTH
jgi:ATP-dependent Lon protease